MTPKGQATKEKTSGTHQTKKLSSKRQKITSVGEDVKILEPMHYWWECRMVHCTLENCVEVIL